MPTLQGPPFTCPICLVSKSPIETHTLPCQQKACSDCLSEWIAQKILEQNLDIDQALDCIFSTCRKRFTIQTVYSSTMLPIYKQKIDKALLKSYLSREQDISKCPKPGCPYAGVIDINAKCKEDLKCELCGTTWTDKAHLPWQDNLMGKFRKVKNSIDESLSWLWKKTKTKQCPNCQVPIEKEDGCFHVVCSRCSYEFCWDCGAEYLTGFPSHYYGAHLLQILIPILWLFGLFWLVLYGIRAIPIVKVFINLIIKPAWGLLIGFADQIIKLGFDFLFANLPWVMITSVFVLPRKEEKLYFLLLTFLSILAFHQMNLYQKILPTIYVDLVIFSGYQLIDVFKNPKKFKSSAQNFLREFSFDFCKYTLLGIYFYICMFKLH